MTAQAEIVDETVLIESLRSGRIGGAYLDVFTQEPLPAESPLWDLPNAVVSPHTAGDAAGWREAVVELFVENLERLGLDWENLISVHAPNPDRPITRRDILATLGR